jgi:hypothetical protein
LASADKKPGIRNVMIVWNDLSPEDIVGKDRIIDKLKLVNDFLTEGDCRETPLVSREQLASFLRNEITKKPGVYCIYNDYRREMLDVGESKNLKGRIRKQLIGEERRKGGPLKFPRLFFAFLKVEKNGMQEKVYNQLPDEEKGRLVKSFQSMIYNSNNALRVCFTSSYLEAIVLEHILIEYFKLRKGQCKYNFQV